MSIAPLQVHYYSRFGTLGPSVRILAYMNSVDYVRRVACLNPTNTVFTLCDKCTMSTHEEILTNAAICRNCAAARRRCAETNRRCEAALRRYAAERGNVRQHVELVRPYMQPVRLNAQPVQP